MNNCSRTTIVAACLQGQTEGDFQEVHSFDLFLKAYVYNSASDAFQPVPRMPDQLPDQICKALSALEQINTAGTLWHVKSVTSGCCA